MGDPPRDARLRTAAAHPCRGAHLAAPRLLLAGGRSRAVLALRTNLLPEAPARGAGTRLAVRARRADRDAHGTRDRPTAARPARQNLRRPRPPARRLRGVGRE